MENGTREAWWAGIAVGLVAVSLLWSGPLARLLAGLCGGR